MTTTPEAPASTAAAMDALDQRLSQRFIALDSSGYFLIKLDRDAAELVLEHYGNTIDDKGLARDSETGERCCAATGAMLLGALQRFTAAVRPNSWASSSRKGKLHTRSVASTMPFIWDGSCRRLSSACVTSRSMCRTEDQAGCSSLAAVGSSGGSDSSCSRISF